MSLIASRRSFIAGLGAIIVAPAIIRSGLLMPVKVMGELAPPLREGLIRVSALRGSFSIGDEVTIFGFENSFRITSIYRGGNIDLQRIVVG